MQTCVWVELIQVMDIVKGDLTGLDSRLEQLFDVLVDSTVHCLHHLVQFYWIQLLRKFRVQLYLRYHVCSLLTRLNLRSSLNKHAMEGVSELHLLDFLSKFILFGKLFNFKILRGI